MKKYRLNKLDDNWIFPGENEEAATKEYLRQVGLESIEDYVSYMESIGLDSKIEWEEEE